MADTLLDRAVAVQSDPPIGAIAINYGSADQTFTKRIRGIYVAVTGNLKVDMADGTTVTWSNLAAGVVYPMTITKIYQTGSTGVTGLVLY
jgi:hypothetical protein